MQSLPSSGCPGAKSLRPERCFDELPLAVEDDEGEFAACGALKILGDEIEQGGGFARAGAGDDPVVRSAGLRRDIDGKRGREEARERRAVRNGEGSSR